MLTCDVLFPLICDAQFCNRYTHICQDGHAHPVGGRETLGQIAHGSADFAVGPSVLTHDKLGDFGVGGGDVYGVLQSLFINPH